MSPKNKRMSIDIPVNDHKRLKILADAQEITIRELVLNSLDPILHPKKEPNKNTKEAMKAAREGHIFKATDLDDLWNKLGI
ncbi:MAG: hypothetical protein HYZ47_00865 [Simkania negevensis]|nr:hypothetical protein [Simkania negevensis]